MLDNAMDQFFILNAWIFVEKQVCEYIRCTEKQRPLEDEQCFSSFPK